MPLSEIAYYIQTSIDGNILWHLSPRESHLKSCRGIPMEDTRFDEKADVIAAFFTTRLSKR
jgi:hypothetical protein